MEEDEPVNKLTTFILLGALSKRADRIRIDGTTSACVVTFRINGVYQEEMRPPALLRAAIVRRRAVLANLPTWPRGGSAEGEIGLVFDHRPEPPRFAVRVAGHGGALTATLDVLEGYRPDS